VAHPTTIGGMLADLGHLVVANTRHIFPFEKLSPELRNNIYTYALVATDSIKITHQVDTIATMKAARTTEKAFEHGLVTKRESSDTRWCSTARVKISGQRKLQPYESLCTIAILLLNKQVYSEAMTMLYGKNRFKFTTSVALRRFADLAKHGMQLFVDVEIRGPRLFGMQFDELFELKEASRIRHLHFGVTDHQKAGDRLDTAPKRIVEAIMVPLRDS